MLMGIVVQISVETLWR